MLKRLLLIASLFFIVAATLHGGFYDFVRDVLNTVTGKQKGVKSASVTPESFQKDLENIKKGTEAVINKIGEGAEFVGKIGETVFVDLPIGIVERAGDLINVATSGGHCPSATFECFAGYGEGRTSCGTVTVEGEWTGSGIGKVTGKCRYKTEDAKKLCDARCREETKLADKPVDSSEQVYRSQAWYLDPKSVVDCYAGNAELEVNCGRIEVNRDAEGLGKGFRNNPERIRTACNNVCKSKFDAESTKQVVTNG